MLAKLLALAALGLLFTASCQTPRGVQLHLQEPFPRKLTEWHLFVGQPRRLQPNQGVVPYDINTPLFSDYADKHRFVWMPAGSFANYRPDGVFEFPLGTIFSKTFAFPLDGHPGAERLIETRLLVRTRSGWVGVPYVWNRAQTEATLQIDADPVPVRFHDPSAASARRGTSSPTSTNARNATRGRPRRWRPGSWVRWGRAPAI